MFKGLKDRDSGLTLLEIMMILAIMGLLYAIVVSSFHRYRIDSNDTLAQSILRSMSTAAEMYARDHDDSYAPDMTSITGATPPYIGRDYCGLTISGFRYTCMMDAFGYNFIAQPEIANMTGSASYVITAGGYLESY